MHAHDYYEIEIILDGKGKHIFNGKTYPIQPGSVYIVSPSDFHSVELDGVANQWNISFDETVISPNRLEEIYSNRVCRVLSEEELSKLNIAAKLLEEENETSGFVQPLCDYIMTVILNTPEKDAYISPIKKAILYIEAHFRESPTLSAVAEQACLSPVYFGNLFKQETGETYISYLNGKKVNCAKMLLKTGMSVTDVCFNSGFGSLSGFLHSFKQKTGMSPEAYKEQFYKKKK